MNLISMYTTRTCPYCQQAKALLGRRGITPIEIRIDLDDARHIEMMERTGRRTVPQIFIGERHIGGFDDLTALEHTGELEALV